MEEENGWEIDEDGFVCSYYELDGAAFLRSPGRHQERLTKGEFKKIIETAIIENKGKKIQKLLLFLFRNSTVKFKGE